MLVSFLVIYEWEIRIVMGEDGVEGEEVVCGLIENLGVSGDYFLENCCFDNCFELFPY
jgi:hypothetical protein